VQTCIWPSWCHCHSLSLASVKSRLVLPFWYRLTWVVQEKRDVQRVCVCVCVCLLPAWTIAWLTPSVIDTLHIVWMHAACGEIVSVTGGIWNAWKIWTQKCGTTWLQFVGLHCSLLLLVELKICSQFFQYLQMLRLFECDRLAYIKMPDNHSSTPPLRKIRNKKVWK